MNRFVRYRRGASVLGALFLAVGLLGTVRVSRAGQEEDRGAHERKGSHEKYLLVWAGDQSRSNPDFLSVINFNEQSSHYGEVLRTVPLPGPGATGNEPHHVGLSKDGKVLATG